MGRKTHYEAEPEVSVSQRVEVRLSSSVVEHAMRCHFINVIVETKQAPKEKSFSDILVRFESCQEGETPSVTLTYEPATERAEPTGNDRQAAGDAS